MRLRLLLVAALGALVLATGASGATAPVTYYIALGDSLAAGTQPGAAVTRQGYPHQLLALQRAKAKHRNLRLVNLGCPGATSQTLVAGGGHCRYAQGSQLRQAEWLLRRHGARVAFVTVMIGANDVLRCGTSDPECLALAHVGLQVNLETALRRLKAARARTVQLVGADYYAPGLALWLSGPSGAERAREYVQAFAAPGNRFVRGIYAKHGVPVAQVEAAFATLDFDTSVPLAGVGAVPLNVARICAWTWMCTHQDIHATYAGHDAIARAFARRIR
jgi:lysophospholipase L1-like esterase